MLTYDYVADSTGCYPSYLLFNGTLYVIWDIWENASLSGAAPPSHPKSIALPSSRNCDKTEDTQPSPKCSLGGGLALMRVIGLDKQDFYDGMDYFSCSYPPIFTSFKWVHPTCP